jgi:drug/metabolite transporter (DMT)-like permease
MRKRNAKIKALLALVLANVIWGLTPAFNKLGLQELAPLWLFVSRYLLATIFLLFIFRPHGKRIKPKDHIKVALSGWIGISLTIVAMYYGLRITRAIDAAVISSLGPIILFWLSIIFLKDQFKWQPLIGTLIALAGSLIVVLGYILRSDNPEGSIYLLGGLMVFGSIFADQIGAIITQPLLKKYDMSLLALWRLLYAIVPVFLLAIWLEPVPTFNIRPETAFSLLYLALIGIVIAFAFYYYGAKRLKVEDFSVLFYVDPIFGVLSSMLILGERPNVMFLSGVLCIIVGILVAELHIKTKLKFRVMHLPRH